MKKCGHSGEQEKCDHYTPKCSKPGKVNLTCIWFLRDFLGKNGGSICRYPSWEDEK